ncbi:HTTM domain-containing protein [Maribacter ulvicola]|uniref:Vitamin K-dependent gamma-carboxylase n=1 Tax=Maribacter ulvicola TaxID=228959 RepID=A0A1N6Q6Y9_9FLAO|nr:HTTM domain-containing protein [Maribacter ulvicola]SIQ12403.1 Vitamin K-dependent gamma-carboxylase [Maribacter ulvicola]
MLHRLLFQRIDNSSLIIFRIFFGILVSLECFGAIATGWVHRNLIAPKYKFPFIDFDFLQPLPGYGMYFYFGIMGLMGLFIAVGYRYRASIITFTILWTATYLMQKTAYNNHYYLLILISGIMCFFPAERGSSLDVKRNPKLESNSMYAYIKWIVVLQLLIVYVYASIAKMYGDWLDFSTIEVLMRSRKNYWLVGEILQEKWIHKIIGSVGILFDLLIVPALLWKPTRKVAFFLSVFFHLFNSIIFQIGIFPYLSIAFSVFFFEPETIRKLFFKTKVPFMASGIVIPKNKNMVLITGAMYFTIQLLLPIRHYAFTDDVLWNEEGHRMSWRMMLRSRQGKGTFKVVDNDTKEEFIIQPKNYVSRGQERKIFAYPDFAWQFAQYLEQEFAEQHREVSVYLENSKISINRKPYKPFIDPKTNLAAEEWYHTKHHNWILPSNNHTSEN